MPGRLSIRPVDLEGAERLAALAERTFRAAFADENTATDMEAYVREAFSVERVRAELADEANTFLFACHDETGEPIGYAKLRTGTADPSVRGADPIELERLYVDSAAIGHGVGAALMQASLDMARAMGYRTIWLGVWERNARAIGFYKRWGFEAVGDHVFQLGSDAQTDLIMERPTT